MTAAPTLGTMLEAAFRDEMAMRQLNDRIRQVTQAAGRASWALEALAVRTEVNNYLLANGHKRPAVRDAGLQARFYMRGALDPRFTDQARATRYFWALYRRRADLGLAFTRGLADRADQVPADRGGHTFHRWGSESASLVLR